MIEFGFKSIALVGQDLAFAPDGDMYTEGAHLDMSEKRLKAMGERFSVKSFDGKEVETNNSFYYFGQSYERFADELKDSGIGLYNCTEGGMYLDGFKHCKLIDFIVSETKEIKENSIQSILDGNHMSKESEATGSKNMRQYVIKNLSLSNEISSFIKGAMEIVLRKDFSDHKIAKFDKLQNKVIKKMKKNYFFELGLQRELYMLQSGLSADRSLEGQVAFHMDFLSAVKKFNNIFRNALRQQFKLLNSN